MRYSNSDKDRTLAAFYHGRLAYYGSEDVITILKADGYLETLTSPNGIVTRLTDKGRAFYLSGGYTEREYEKKKNSRREFRRNITTAIIGSLSGAILGFFAGILANWLNISG